MRWRGKKVLVTGGASFLGSHLVDKLVELNANVRVADDFSSGKAENLAKNIDYIEILKGNLKDMCFAKLVMKNVDLVFHLAASHGGRGYIDTHPVECCSNMALDGIVFELAFKVEVDRICFASSTCVYPTDLQSKNIARRMLLLKEDMVDPFSRGNALADGEYGWAKLMGEMTLRAYYNEYGMKCSSCRIFTLMEKERTRHMPLLPSLQELS
jgi:UDP-glucose 4-epimerase